MIGELYPGEFENFPREDGADIPTMYYPQVEGITPTVVDTGKQEPVLDKIKGYIDYIRNTGMGKKKSLEFIEKFIDGLKAESEDKEQKE